MLLIMHLSFTKTQGKLMNCSWTQENTYLSVANDKDIKELAVYFNSHQYSWHWYSLTLHLHLYQRAQHGYNHLFKENKRNKRISEKWSSHNRMKFDSQGVLTRKYVDVTVFVLVWWLSGILDGELAEHPWNALQSTKMSLIATD